MKWYIAAIIKMLEIYRSFGLCYDENKSIEQLRDSLILVTKQIEDSYKETLPTGAAFILLYSFEIRLQKALMNKEIITNKELREFFIAANIVAWKACSDHTIHNDDFDISGISIGKLNKIEMDYLKSIDYKLVIEPEYIIKLLRQYCDAANYSSLADTFWQSSETNMSQYAITWLADQNITSELLTDCIKKSSTIQHLRCLLDHVVLTTPIIEAIQDRAIALAYQNPWKTQQYKKYFLDIFSLASPGAKNIQLKEEYSHITRIPAKFTPNWHIDFIMKKLSHFKVFRSRYSLLTIEPDEIFHALTTVLKGKPDSFYLKSYLTLLVANYLDDTSSKKPIIAPDFLTFFIGCVSGLTGSQSPIFYFFGKTLGEEISDQCLHDFLKRHPEITLGFPNDLLGDFLSFQLYGANFQHLCGIEMAGEQDVDATTLELIYRRLKHLGEVDEVLSIIYCTTTTAQLTQISELLNRREFDFLRENNSHPATLFKAISDWDKIQCALRVMRTIYENQMQGVEYIF